MLAKIEKPKALESVRPPRISRSFLTFSSGWSEGDLPLLDPAMVSDAILERAVEIDHHVAAEDDIDLRERRILGQILAGEDADVTDCLADAVAAIVSGQCVP